MSDPYSVIFIKSFKFEMPSQKFMSQVNYKWWSVDTVSVVMNENSKFSKNWSQSLTMTLNTLILLLLNPQKLGQLLIYYFGGLCVVKTVFQQSCSVYVVHWKKCSKGPNSSGLFRYQEKGNMIYFVLHLFSFLCMVIML